MIVPKDKNPPDRAPHAGSNDRKKALYLLDYITLIDTSLKNN